MEEDHLSSINEKMKETMYNKGIEDWKMHRMSPQQLNQTIQNFPSITNSRTTMNNFNSHSNFQTKSPNPMHKFSNRITNSKLVKTKDMISKRQLELQG